MHELGIQSIAMVRWLKGLRRGGRTDYSLYTLTRIQIRVLLAAFLCGADLGKGTGDRRLGSWHDGTWSHPVLELPPVLLGNFGLIRRGARNVNS